MKPKVGEPYYYHLMFGRIVNLEEDRIYFATPHGSLYNPTERQFDYSAYRLKDTRDLERLAYFEQKALDDGKELYGGRITEFTHLARASRYGYDQYGYALFDREKQKTIYGIAEMLSHLRALEEKLEHVMSAVKTVAYSGDFAIGDDAISTLMAAYEDVTEGNVGTPD